MGRFIEVSLRDEYAVTGTTELDTELPAKLGILTDIDIILHGLGHASQTLATMKAAISAIKVEGAGEDTWMNLSGAEAVALATYKSGKREYSLTSTNTGLQTRLHIPLNFGRFRHDKKYALDLRNYRNKAEIKCRIEFNATNLGYFTTASYITMKGTVYIPDAGEATPRTTPLKSYKELDITAGTSRVQESIPINVEYHGFLLYVSVVGANEYSDVKLTGNVQDKTFIKTKIAHLMQDAYSLLDDAAYAEMVASGDITTAYLYIKLKNPLDTRRLSDLTYDMERLASTTCVLIPIVNARPNIPGAPDRDLPTAPAVPVQPPSRMPISGGIAGGTATSFGNATGVRSVRG